MTSLVVGFITCGIALFSASQSDWFDAINASYGNDTTFVNVTCGIIGFIIGIALCLIVMGVISSAVNATIVCFADAPQEFESNYPELSREMRDAYLKAHP